MFGSFKNINRNLSVNSMLLHSHGLTLSYPF